jgi:hypothetical protein
VDQSNVVVGLFITDRGGRVTLAHNPPTIPWTAVRAGETPPAAATRLGVEYGLTAEVGELLTIDWADGEVFLLFDTAPSLVETGLTVLTREELANSAADERTIRRVTEAHRARQDARVRHIDRDHARAPRPVEPGSFREKLANWTDWDIAAWRLGIALGVYPSDTAFTWVKSAFYGPTPTPPADALLQLLDRLVEVGLLQESENEYRWQAGPT